MRRLTPLDREFWEDWEVSGVSGLVFEIPTYAYLKLVWKRLKETCMYWLGISYVWGLLQYLPCTRYTMLSSDAYPRPGLHDGRNGATLLALYYHPVENYSRSCQLLVSVLS